MGKKETSLPPAGSTEILSQEGIEQVEGPYFDFFSGSSG
jgi:hypothetical protein